MSEAFFTLGFQGLNGALLSGEPGVALRTPPASVPSVVMALLLPSSICGHCSPDVEQPMVPPPQRFSMPSFSTARPYPRMQQHLQQGLVMPDPFSSPHSFVSSPKPQNSSFFRESVSFRWFQRMLPPARAQLPAAVSSATGTCGHSLGCHIVLLEVPSQRADARGTELTTAHCPGASTVTGCSQLPSPGMGSGHLVSPVGALETLGCLCCVHLSHGMSQGAAWPVPASRGCCAGPPPAAGPRIPALGAVPCPLNGLQRDRCWERAGSRCCNGSSSARANPAPLHPA